jgi:chitodextrinase
VGHGTTWSEICKQYGFTMKISQCKLVGLPVSIQSIKKVRVRKNCLCLLFSFIIVFMVLFSSLVMVVGADSPTIVSIAPASQTVSAETSFTMTVNCSPARPVKGFELKVSFNPSILQATSVSEGDFFEGYTTFFNPGIINNQAGTIINVYDLIVGQGNVTTNGSFVTIVFTARSISGSSAVTLYGVQVTNETEYINVSVSSASVMVTGGSSPPPSPPPSEPPVSPPIENAPLGAPVKPVGPAFIEAGTINIYNSSSFDPEGGRVRLRFDWGDGSFSDWSGFVNSNVSVSSSHSWSTVSRYSVRVIAQDEAGLNGSWSEPLIVVVSQATSENQTPVASFVLPPKVTSNESMVFDASGSIDADGVIVSYVWDFGDGTLGTGKSPTHVYQSPGQYIVTLTVTDDTGLTSSATMMVTVSAQTPSPPPVTTISLSSYVPFIALVGVLGALLVFVVVFRDPLRAMLFRGTPVPSVRTMSSSESDVAEIEELLDMLFRDINKQAIPVSKERLLDAYCDLIIENVEANVGVRLPHLSIAEVERIVDENFHSKVSEKIDKM